jgi:hypothetical protein
VLHAAIERHGSPGTIVTDGGGIFRSGRAKAVYRALGIEKEEIERGRPWQSFIETTFNIQRRMADFHFGRVTTRGSASLAAPALFLALIHRSAWNRNSRKLHIAPVIRGRAS